ncbi:hypothetical protein [Galenea microaerophila]
MKSEEYFKKNLKKPALLTLILFLLAGLEFYAFSKVKQQQSQQFMQTKQKLDGLVRQLEYLREQYTLYHKYGPQYQKLVKQGMTQKQDRVLWTDILLQASERYVINKWMVQFEPQKEIKQAELQQLKLTSPVFYQTRVNMVGGAQSDLDIFAILEDISRQISPFYLLKECQIERINGGRNQETEPLVFSLERSNFNFRCALIFVNAQPKPYQAESQSKQKIERDIP